MANNNKSGALGFEATLWSAAEKLKGNMDAAEYRHEVLASATGTTVKHTSPTRILAHKAAIPVLDKQEAISAVLGAFDDKIELNRQMNETLEALAQTLFKTWFVNAAASTPKNWGEISIAEHNRRESRTLAELRDALLPRLLSGDLRLPAGPPP
jgi:restriction endonuclease S subunit